MRVRKWEEVLARFSTVADAQAADDRFVAAGRLGVIVVILGAIALAVWSGLISLNARSRGVLGIRPRWATLSWFIPLFGIYHGIHELARSVRGVDYSSGRLFTWLFAMYVQTVFTVITYLTFSVSAANAYNTSSALDALQRERWILIVRALVMGTTAVLASRAIRHADRAVTGRLH